MVNRCLSAVCGVLSRNFSFPVYTEPVAQGLQTPSFFVTVEDVAEKRMIGLRRRLAFTVKILYLPNSSEDRRSDAMAVAGRLMPLFRLLDTGSGTVHCFSPRCELTKLARGFNRGFEPSDEVLAFRFDIKTFYVETQTDGDEPAMRTYTLQQEMK